MSDLATVPPRRQHIDSIPWARWVDLETACPDAKFAKLALELVARRLHRYLMAEPSLLPVAFIRKGKEMQVQSTQQIKKGGCVIPFFRKESSMVMEGEQNGLRVRNGVHCKVTWTQGPVSETQVEAFGEYNEEFEQSVFITP